MEIGFHLPQFSTRFPEWNRTFSRLCIPFIMCTVCEARAKEETAMEIHFHIVVSRDTPYRRWTYHLPSALPPVNSNSYKHLPGF